PAGRRQRAALGCRADARGPPAAAAHLRQQRAARDARLRVLGRERAARPVRAGRRPRLDRFRDVDVAPPGRSAKMPRVRVVVVGGGSWGTPFSVVLRDRGHQGALACRDPHQSAAIRAAGGTPRSQTKADLAGDSPCSIQGAPFEEADLIVVAVPSRGFGEVVAELPGQAPVLSLTKGLDPATGARLSTLVDDHPVAVLSGPNIADEIVAGLPAAAVVASPDTPLALP